MDIEEIRKENADLRARLSKLRSKLPGPGLPDAENWLTIDQAAELLDAPAAEAERALEKMELKTDASGRLCIRRDKFDRFVVAAAADKRPEAFL